MSQRRTLRPGARTSGALLLAALAVLNLTWIVRDFDKAATVTDAWWMWSGMLFRAQDGIWASSFLEPTLLVLYTVCAVTALLSSSAAGVLVSTGVLTILLRAPTLWNLNASWVQGGVSDGLRSKALFSAITMLVLAVALIVIAAAGRRPAADAENTDTADSSDSTRSAESTTSADAPEDPQGTGPAPDFTGSRNTRDEAPVRPTPRGGLAASLLLGAVAVVLVAWEINSLSQQGWSLYSRHFTGDRTLVTLLAVPESWYGWALALFAVSGSTAAFRRARFARPLGMIASAPLLGLGLFHLSYAAKAGLLGEFGTLPMLDRLRLITAVFEILAALALLLALAARDGEPTDPPAHSSTIRSFSSA
jgi:hypothetical protein